MIKDPQYYSRFKAHSLASAPLDLAQKYAILESLYLEARMLGKFGNDDLLLGLEDDIRLAAALNANLRAVEHTAQSNRISGERFIRYR